MAGWETFDYIQECFDGLMRLSTAGQGKAQPIFRYSFEIVWRSGFQKLLVNFNVGTIFTTIFRLL